MPKHTKKKQPERNAFFKAYWAALSWAALILLLISLPGEDLPDMDIWAIDIEDKIGHLAVFGVLSFLMVYGSFRQGNPLTRKELTIVLSLGTIYGGLTEVLQGLVFTSRFASVSDFLADLLGVVLGTVFGYLVFKRRY